MRNVIIDCSDFAPSSLPPALRIRFFANYLAEFGWNPILVTTDARYYEQTVDWENERLVSDSVEVIRTKAIPAAVSRRLAFGDLGLRSLWHHWAAMRDVCSRRKVDLVFISVPPYFPIVLGRLIKRQFGIPYVIDYIDPWVTDYYWHLPRKLRPPKWPLADAISRTLEPLAIRHASAIVGVSSGTTEGIVARYKWLKGIPTAEIPYGGELADFEYLKCNPRKQAIFDRGDGMLHMSYIGVCSPQHYSAVRAVFDAIRLGLARAPKTFARLRLHFVGSTYAPSGTHSAALISQMARDYGVQEFVDEKPERVSYLESLQLLLDSHVLLLLGSEEPHYTASKVFPYLLSGRPLFAVFNEASTVVSILREVGKGCVVTFSERNPASSQANLISTQLEQVLLSSTDRDVGVSQSRFEKYTTRAMTARLAALFDSVVSPSNTSAESVSMKDVSGYLSRTTSLK